MTYHQPITCSARHFGAFVAGISIYLLLETHSIRTASLPGAARDKPHDQDQHQNLYQPDQSDQSQQIAPPKLHPTYLFDKQLSPYMQLQKLSPTRNNITCNDGSRVGYYMRQNSHSKSWIIYLQGGGYCGSEESCQQRWQRSPFLMSSDPWPKTKSVDGILSSEPKDNPYLWNANHVYIPYCSSDSWTGLAPAKSRTSSGYQSNKSFSFMGSRIIERVLDSLYEDLPADSSLYEARYILLAGDSAGATGVMMNLDKVNEIVEQRFKTSKANCSSSNNEHVNNCDAKQRPVLRGLADSGWFLDNEPYDFGRGGDGTESLDVDDCDRNKCSPVQSIKQAMLFWDGQVPRDCSIRYQSEPWRCYFGYRTYQTLKTPLFVVQWLYDEAQLLVDNIARPETNGQWNYVNKVVNEMRSSLENVTALFAPSCFSHSLVIRRTWNQININGLKLPHVLNSWEEQSLQDSSAADVSLFNQALRVGDGGQLDRQIEIEVKSSQSSDISSSPTIFNRPTSETPVPKQQEATNVNYPLVSLLQSPLTLNPRESQEYPPASGPNFELRAALGPRQPVNSSKSRSRKRKRNNSQQGRGKPSRGQKSMPHTDTLPREQPISSREFSIPTPSSTLLQDQLPLIDGSLAPGELLFSQSNRDQSGSNSNQGRLGRSTFVDDATLIFNNNVPDDNTASQSTPNQSDQRGELRWNWSAGDQPASTIALVSPPINNKVHNADRFRLIDVCGWPQCNRDCPVLSLDFNLGINFQI